MGLALHNARAVAEGFWGRATPFMRTPKQGSVAGRLLSVPTRSRGALPLAEGLLTLYFLIGLGAGLYYGDYGLLPFHLLLVVGHATVVWYAWQTGLAASPVLVEKSSVLVG